jgi:hypothetical protein
LPSISLNKFGPTVVRGLQKWLFLVLLLLVMTGCEQKRSYSYYMQHPGALREAVGRCQSSALPKSTDQAAACEIALYAASNVMSLLREQQTDPEAFGQRILDAEAACIRLKASVKRAERSLHEARSGNVSMAEIRAAQDDLYKAQQAWNKQLQEVKALLAVVGMSSPD